MTSNLVAVMCLYKEKQMIHYMMASFSKKWIQDYLSLQVQSSFPFSVTCNQFLKFYVLFLNTKNAIVNEWMNESKNK